MTLSSCLLSLSTGFVQRNLIRWAPLARLKCGTPVPCVQVVAGGEHSALLDAGGRLWLWGRGLGGEAAAAAAAASGVSGSAALRTADIAAAGLATCADATDKAALACAGRGPERAPGVGPKRDSRQVGGRGSGTPVQVHVPLPTRAAPTAMSATEAAQALASVREDGVGCPEPEGTEAAAAAAAVGGECHWRQVGRGLAGSWGGGMQRVSSTLLEPLLLQLAVRSVVYVCS